MLNNVKNAVYKQYLIHSFDSYFGTGNAFLHMYIIMIIMYIIWVFTKLNPPVIICTYLYIVIYKLYTCMIMGQISHWLYVTKTSVCMATDDR